MAGMLKNYRHKNSVLFIISIAIISSLFSGCASYFDEERKSYNRFAPIKINVEDQRIEDDESEFSHIQRNIDAVILTLGEQLSRSARIHLEEDNGILANMQFWNDKPDRNETVFVTSFVELENLQTTTEFGRLLSESMMSELHSRGYTVVDFRGKDEIFTGNKGEFFLSRRALDVKFKNYQNITPLVMVGTYSRQTRAVIINARILEYPSGKLVASSRVLYKVQWKKDCLIFNDCDRTRPGTFNIIDDKVENEDEYY
jgi:TolB-like protein